MLCWNKLLDLFAKVIPFLRFEPWRFQRGGSELVTRPSVRLQRPTQQVAGGPLFLSQRSRFHHARLGLVKPEGVIFRNTWQILEKLIQPSAEILKVGGGKSLGHIVALGTTAPKCLISAVAVPNG